MQVQKRNGKFEEVKFDKILDRVKSLSYNLNRVDPVLVAQKVVPGLFDKITAKEIDSFLARTAANLTDEHHQYSILAGRIAASSMHKETQDSFYHTMKALSKDGQLSENLMTKVRKYHRELQKAIDFERDMEFDYFGLSTLQGGDAKPGYLLRINNKIVERPQHLFMRVSIEVSGDSVEEIVATYELISSGKYTHATPTLFNSGLKKPQLASCFLTSIEDSIEGIFDAYKECAMISKHSGGIGIHVSNIRASGTKIEGNNGFSSGLIPWMKIMNDVARAVNQGGKRPGSIAVYLEPWHADVEAFLELKKRTGDENIRARDLFIAMWTPDLFFKRAEADEEWSLMCPKECPGLQDVYGEEFDALYEKYEAEGRYKSKISARLLMSKICQTQIENGMPYMLSKDAVNKKSNQKNIGVIKSSNLCAEILEVSNSEYTAVCNLASVALSKFVNRKTKTFNFDELQVVVARATKNLNNVIDRTYYPTEKCKVSNFATRPIGIGVQGLADVFFMLDMAFDSDEAVKLDRMIFEAIYFAFLKQSMEESKVHGPYDFFAGSPASEGILQFDMWGVEPSDRHDWAGLKEDIKKYGLRNSLGIALMPTASTASIFGNTEAFEPQKGNLFKREISAGEFILVNKFLVEKLDERGIWNPALKNLIAKGRGSIQHIQEIPDDIKLIFKHAYEMSQRWIINHAAARGPFVDQTQSMNLFFEEPTIAKLNSAINYGWKSGLKTLNYYIRVKTKVEGTMVGDYIAPQASPTAQAKEAAQGAATAPVKKEFTAEEALACSIDNPEDCEACSS